MNNWDYLILLFLAISILGLLLDTVLKFYINWRKNFEQISQKAIKELRKGRVMAILLIGMILFSSMQAGATSTTYHVIINFSPGATSNSSFDYITITPENSSLNASITITAWEGNRTIYIGESNVEKIVLDAKKAMNEFGITSGDVETALRLAGEIRLILAGNGTNTYQINNLPAVAKVYLDGTLPGNYSISGDTLTLTTHMSTHVLTIEFKPYSSEIYDAISTVIYILIPFGVIFLFFNIIDDVFFGKILKEFEDGMKQIMRRVEKRR